MNIKHLICAVIAGLTIGYSIGLELGYGIGKREVQDEAVLRRVAHREYQMAGLKSHYKFVWGAE